MQTAVNTNAYTDMQSLQGIKTLQKKDNDAALKSVAKQFESIFLKMMLKSMRDATMKGGLFDSDDSQTYQELYDHQLSLSLGSKGRLGIADMLYQQLSRKHQVPGTGKQAYSPSVVPAAAKTTRAAGPAVITAGNQKAVVHKTEKSRVPVQPVVTDKSAGYTSPQDFVQKLMPYAKKAAKVLGVSYKVLIAQAALETGWGQKMIMKNGKPVHNYFGIKSNNGWKGESASAPTLEFQNGAMVRKTEKFRVYGNIGQAFDNYVNFIKDNPRYHEALKSGGSPAKYLSAISKGGYATDPHYADKIRNIMTGKTMSHSLARAGG